MNENAVVTNAVVGIDVAKKKVDLFVVCNEKGKAKVFDNTPAGHREIQHWLRERGFVPAHRFLMFCWPAPLKGGVSATISTVLLTGRKSHDRLQIRTEQ